MQQQPLLEVRKISKSFGGGFLQPPPTVAVKDFSLTLPIDNPRMIAIAGESGSGKTTVARMVLGFITPDSGEILYKGENLAKMSRIEASAYRREVQAILQDPYAAYNPFYKVDRVLNLVIQKFKLADSRSVAQSMVEEALAVVGLDPSDTLGKYPHQLSGGQRQRLITARAFLLKPRIIVADEPVSMVDASRRAMILEIMLRLKQEFGISFLYITHDLSTAYDVCDDIIILYRGEVVEQGNAQAVISNPQHSYTRLLVDSIPIPDPDICWKDRLELTQEIDLISNR
jgi:peptide/nickel transport system ATP-binding protein